MNTPSLPVLFLGGAKRVAMARLFRKAAAQLGYKLELYSYELSTDEPIALEAKVIKGLRWSDPALFHHLADIVKTHGIKLIVPFVDGAIAPAAAFVRRFPELNLCLPAPEEEIIETCNDKLLLSRLLAVRHIPQPQPFGTDSLKLIAKPRRGAASNGLVLIDIADSIARAGGNPDDYIIQQYIADRTEYSVDCYISLRTGQTLVLSPRRRIATAGGEVIDTVTVDEPDIIALARQAITSLRLTGAVTIQIIRDNTDGRLYIMEINPRLGGGAVCSVEAGAGIPSCILRETLGLDCNPSVAQPGVRLKRYMDSVVFRPDTNR